MSYLLKNGGPHTLSLAWGSDVGDVTIGIVDANGDEVVAAGTATTNTDGVYTYELASQTTVGVLTATWTDTDAGDTRVTTHEVIGSELFTVADVRAFRVSGPQTPFADTEKFPEATILRWHQVIAEFLEERTGRSWIRRYARVEIPGSGHHRLHMMRGRARTVDGTLDRPGRFHDVATVLSVTVDGTSVDTANVTPDGAVLHRTDRPWSQPTVTRPLNVAVEYEYGAYPTPAEARETALRLFAANASPTDVSVYATSWNNEDGTFRISTWPVKVEEWLKNHNWEVTAIG